MTQQVPQIVTHTPEASHNAVSALVNMYGPIIADLKRDKALLQQQLKFAQDEVANQKLSNEKLNELFNKMQGEIDRLNKLHPQGPTDATP